MIPELDLIYSGDCLEIMSSWPDAFIQTVVTSPPYWGLRDYGVPGQIGMESSPESYTAKMVEVFKEVRRVLRDDGTLWLNLGDSYCSNPGNGRAERLIDSNPHRSGMDKSRCGLKPKDLVGIPWRVAFALQADGWYLRSDIIWSKPNPMPESVRDRPTKSHEYLFLLSKSERYFYDHEAIKERVTGNAHSRGGGVNPKARIPSGWDTRAGTSHHEKTGRYKALPDGQSNLGRFRDAQRNRVKQNPSFSAAVKNLVDMRNKRSVWTVGTFAFLEAHFATYPPELIKPCVLAGSRPDDIILDPFMGAGTTALVAATYGRRFIGCELNPEYAEIAKRRIAEEVAQEKMTI